MRWLLLVAGLLACHPAAAYLPPGPGLPTASNEEFVGPFANWLNVRTGKRADGTGSLVCTAATGNGTTDDAAALQSCIDLLGSTYPILWVPAGTYKINSCLHVGSSSCTAGQTGLFGVGIIGADPATTIIKWGGSAGGTMIAIRGISYSQFNRLTFDGNNSAAVLVDQEWKGADGCCFDTGNEYTDDVFKNATSMGFRCGGEGEGCADTTMLRDQFINNFTGAWVGNQNALNLYFWYCLFQDNSYGVSNIYPIGGAGSFQVYNSVFMNSLHTDIAYSFFVAATFSNNYSIGAGAGGGTANGDGHFLFGGGAPGVEPVLVQGNTILDWSPGNASFPQAVFHQTAGPLTLIDNIFRNSVTNASGPVASSGISVASQFSLGNTFTVGAVSSTCAGSSPVTILASGLCHSISDQVVNRSTINPGQPTLPGTPPNYGRTIIEVPDNSSPATIQSAINSAVAAGSRSVVHLQAGATGYLINVTLTTSANSDIQIIGDGFRTSAGWNGSAGQPMLKLNGPSKVVLRDFRFNPHATADGIEINTADQEGSRVFMQIPIISNTVGAGIFVDTLDYTVVEMHDAQFLSNTTVAKPGIKVVGGTSAQAGTWLGGQTNWFNGLTSDDRQVLDISGGANVYVGSVWSEIQCEPVTDHFLMATGSEASSISIINGALQNISTTLINFDNFLGKSVALGLPMNGRLSIDTGCTPNTAAATSHITITGTATGSQNLGLGLSGWSPPYYNNTASGAAVEFLNSYNNTSLPVGGPTTLAETAISTPFLTSTLHQMRTTKPLFPIATPAGVTGVQMYRIVVEGGVNNIHIRN